MIDREKLDSVLLEMGFDDSLSGTEMIRRAVHMWHPDIIITKELYPALVAGTGKRPCRAERNIRHAIERAFDVMPVETIYKYFGNSIEFTKSRPDNRQFLARLAIVCTVPDKEVKQ